MIFIPVRRVVDRVGEKAQWISIVRWCLLQAKWVNPGHPDQCRLLQRKTDDSYHVFDPWSPTIGTMAEGWKQHVGHVGLLLAIVGGATDIRATHIAYKIANRRQGEAC